MSVGEADTYIAPGLFVQGKLLGKGSVRIEGRLEGEIDIEGVLTVGATARVVAPVRADAVSVAGEIGGLVRANALVEVHVGGCIDGDVWAPQVTVDEGGQVTGRIERTSLKDAAVTGANVLGTFDEIRDYQQANRLKPLGRVKARVRARTTASKGRSG